MRKLPTILAVLFIAITLNRVGLFADQRMHGGWPGWVFSSAICAGVFAISYWTRDSVTSKDENKENPIAKMVKERAWQIVVLFALMDGFYNTVEVIKSVAPASDDYLLWVATIGYGTLPTIAVAFLGSLQGYIDRLPKPPVNAKRDVLGMVKVVIVSKLAKLAEPELSPAKPADNLPTAKVAKMTKKEKVTSSELTPLQEIILSSPHVSNRQIAKQVGKSHETVRLARVDLEKAGYLSVNGTNGHHKNGVMS